MSGRTSLPGQLGHLVAGDVRRLAPWLLAIGTVIGALVTGVAPGELGVRTYRLPLGLVEILLLVTAVVAVQGDGPASERPFWATRPVRPVAVAGAKLLFIAVFLWLLPTVAQAFWFERLGAEDISLLTADAGGRLFALLALAAAGAAVTPTLRPFAALAVSVWIGTTVARAVPGLPLPRTPEAHFTVSLAWGALGTLLLLAQFLLRRPRVITTVGVLGVLTIPVVVGQRFGDGAATTGGTAEMSPAPDAAITLRGLSRNMAYTPRGPQPAVMGDFTLRSEPGVSVAWERMSVRLRAGPVDTTFHLGSRFRGRNVFGGRFLPSLEGARLAGSLAEASSSGMTQEPIAVGAEPWLDALEAGRVDADVTLRADSWPAVARLPVVAGSTAAAGGTEILVDRASRMPGMITVAVRVRWIPVSIRTPGIDQGIERRFAFALHSRRYAELLPSTQFHQAEYTQFGFLAGASLFEPGLSVWFSSSAVEGPDGPPLPDDWLDDVELVVFEREPLGSFTLPLTWDIEEWPLRGRLVQIGREGTPR